MIIVYKAIDYLAGGAESITLGASREDTFHGLSEGYGFAYSLPSGSTRNGVHTPLV